MSRAQAPRRQACKHSEFVRGGRPCADVRGLLARSFDGYEPGGIDRAEGSPPKAARLAAMARAEDARQKRCEMVMLTPGGEEFLLQSWAMSPGFAPTKDQTATAPSSPTLTAHFWSGEMRTAFTAFEWATPSAVATPSS